MYTCLNATLLEILCCSSIIIQVKHDKGSVIFRYQFVFYAHLLCQSSHPIFFTSAITNLNWVYVLANLISRCDLSKWDSGG